MYPSTYNYSLLNMSSSTSVDSTNNKKYCYDSRENKFNFIKKKKNHFIFVQTSNL